LEEVEGAGGEFVAFGIVLDVTQIAAAAESVKSFAHILVLKLVTAGLVKRLKCVLIVENVCATQQ